MGLHKAGFEVTGIDLVEQTEYPFSFLQADVMQMDECPDVDLIWASPPCQAFTAYKRRPGHVAPVDNLIPAVRAKLRAWGKPYIIENVVGAPLENPITLCGSMFGLDVQRHRLFETSFPVEQPKCNHGVWTPRFPPATNRKNKRKTVEVGVWRIPLETQHAAMGIDWMSREKLSQSIPPAYAEFLGNAAKQFITR